jgi:hypothetical protein
MDRGAGAHVLLFFATLAATSAVAQQAPPRHESPDIVLTWSTRCDGDRQLGVTIRLDRKVLYSGILRICPGNRDTENGRAKFHFAGGHTFQGEYRTSSNDSVEGDIWQASGDPDDLILGVSFDTGKQILLNTLHIARPSKKTSSELDPGLFITTYPVPASIGGRTPQVH